MNKLDQKVAIVTGGGKGIGLGIAKAFAENGAKVVIAGRHEETLKKACSENGNLSYVVADITKSEDIAGIIGFVKKTYGRLDILVNNAGWCPVKPITEITMQDYNNAFDLDVRALVDMTIQALPLLKESKGNIMILSSVGATHVAANLSLYTGAKAAVENFTRVWALELAPLGIRVNAISPGAIDTDIWHVPGLTEEQSKAHMEKMQAGIPMKRVGKPEDIGRCAVFLASDDAAYVTSSIYAVDGGMGA